mmetsp:Transcript_7577/g.31523  ORF Transcript_7577/g.31523 Transcript_7577/m.31523 type:complete len:276 (+) Transcript_7577:532-1359(+)
MEPLGRTRRRRQRVVTLVRTQEPHVRGEPGGPESRDASRVRRLLRRRERVSGVARQGRRRRPDGRLSRPRQRVRRIRSVSRRELCGLRFDVRLGFSRRSARSGARHGDALRRLLQPRSDHRRGRSRGISKRRENAGVDARGAASRDGAQRDARRPRGERKFVRRVTDGCVAAERDDVHPGGVLCVPRARVDARHVQSAGHRTERRLPGEREVSPGRGERRRQDQRERAFGRVAVAAGGRVSVYALFPRRAKRVRGDHSRFVRLWVSAGDVPGLLR